MERRQGPRGGRPAVRRAHFDDGVGVEILADAAVIGLRVVCRVAQQLLERAARMRPAHGIFELDVIDLRPLVDDGGEKQVRLVVDDRAQFRICLAFHLFAASLDVVARDVAGFKAGGVDAGLLDDA